MRHLFCLIAFLAASVQAAPPLVPVADYHAHLLSPVTAKMAEEPPVAAVALPAGLAPLFRDRERLWNDSQALAALYTEDAVAFNQYGGDSPTWLRGRDAVAEHVSRLFARAYRITPVAVKLDGSSGHLAGYFTRGEGEALKHFGHVFLALRKGSDGAWRIAGETPSFPGPAVREPITAEQLIQHLDDAGIRHGVVLSVAYWFGSAFAPPAGNEYEKVRAENDWVVQQVARYPDRLVAFCGVNPLKDYAVEEIERCAAMEGVKGIKLHFGNSGVDLRKPEHVEKLRRVFRTINERRQAVVAHLWTGPEYEKEGGEVARIFLEQLLPLAPDVPVQIAHMAGGGRSTEPALTVFADAIAAGDPRTKRLYFDVATLTGGQTAEG
ncbi:MAG TPA: amidohydrolase family protein, partial [Thermoanaerobaculia bacterium]